MRVWFPHRNPRNPIPRESRLKFDAQTFDAQTFDAQTPCTQTSDKSTDRVSWTDHNASSVSTPATAR